MTRKRTDLYGQIEEAIQQAITPERNIMLTEICEECGGSVAEKDACYEMAKVTCPDCFCKQFVE